MKDGRPALVFNRIMKQCSDSLVFTSAILNRNGCYAKQMRDIRDVCALAELVAMNAALPPEFWTVSG